MDELDLLKKDWKKSDDKFPKLSYNQIYSMILKRSSSIVKWIFIISILEFVLWTGIAFFIKDTESMKRFESYSNNSVYTPLVIIGYIILAYFFYLFFRNYRNISVTDSAKVLMENIIKTRKTVRYYVLFNLGYLVASTIAALFVEFNNDDILINQAQQAAASGEIFKFYAVFIIATVLMLAVVIGVLLLFYWLIYGLLLKRLNSNYNELKKLEV